MHYRERKQLKSIALKFWPNIISPRLRKSFKNRIGEVLPTDRIQEQKSIATLSAIEPYVFLRVKNEEETLPLTLNSIKSICNRGVIGYNDCTDHSEEIIISWCHAHPQFKPFKYPYSVIPAGSKEYLKINKCSKNTLASYYNAVLDIIPKNEWILKIDADQIYFPNILKHSFTLPRDALDWVSYSRLDLLRVGFDFYVLNYLRPGDHFLIYNQDLYFENVSGYKPDGTFYAYEMLKKGNGKFPKLHIPWRPECSSIHLPFEKKYRAHTPPRSLKIPLDYYLNACDRTQFSDEFIAEILKERQKLASILMRDSIL